MRLKIPKIYRSSALFVVALVGVAVSAGLGALDWSAQYFTLYWGAMLEAISSLPTTFDVVSAENGDANGDTRLSLGALGSPDQLRQAALATAILMIALVGAVYATRFFKLRDLTRYREQHLQHREKIVLSLLDLVSEPMVLVDHQGRFLACNSATEDMFGYKDSELVGKDISILLSAGDLATKNLKLDAAVTAIGSAASTELDHLMVFRKDGLTFPISVSVGRAEIDGQVVYAGLVKDVTADSQIDAATSSALFDAKLAVWTKSDLVETLSTSISPSLSRIHDNSKNLLKGSDREEQAMLIATVEKEIETVKETLSNAISMVESGQRSNEEIEAEFSIKQLLRSVVEYQSSIAAGNGADIATYVAPEVPDRVTGDPEKIKQTFRLILAEATGEQLPDPINIEVNVVGQEGGKQEIQFQFFVGREFDFVTKSSSSQENQYVNCDSEYNATRAYLDLAEQVIETSDGEIQVFETSRGTCIALTLWLRSIERKSVRPELQLGAPTENVVSSSKQMATNIIRGNHQIEDENGTVSRGSNESLEKLEKIDS